MTDRPEVETLRRLAKHYRKWERIKTPNSAHYVALADVVEGVIQRHEPYRTYEHTEACRLCSGDEAWHELWPCPDVRAWLAVAGVVLGE